MLSISLFLPDYMGKSWLIIFFLFFLLSLLGAYWAARKLSSQIVELTAHNDYLDIKWIKRPLFSSKEDQQILWKDMDSFVYERLEQEYQLKIKLKNGSVIRFWDDGYKLQGTRQLSNFYYFMQKKSAELTRTLRKESTQIPLREGKPFMRTKTGTIIAFLSAIVMVVAFILIPIMSDNVDTLREWKFGLFLIIVFIILGILVYFLSSRKVKKTPVKRIPKKTNQDGYPG